MIFISRSWLELKPNEDFNGNQEWFDEYYSRIMLKRDYTHIPKSVFKQWIHPHHHNPETLENYSWIDFSKIEFKLCEWPTNKLLRVNVIESYRDYFENRASYTDFKQFCCLDKDLVHWKESGTWRTPPIIVDVNSLKSILPNSADIKRPFQLVEGHSRLGYLKSLNNMSQIGKAKIASKHEIYLMYEK